MEPLNLDDAIQTKTMELEVAMESGKPHKEVVKIYKELKELQYKKVRRDHALDVPNDLNVA